MFNADLTVWIVFAAGFLSFISPCCLPLYPSYLSYITGVSVKDLQEGRGAFRTRTLFHTVFFIFGFSIIFFALGLSASFIGNLFTGNQELIRKIGGVMIVVMGLMMVGLFKPSILMKDLRFEWNKRPVGYLGSVLVGVTYAAGWTPCVGPILTAVLALGFTNPSEALIYTFSYTLGFAIPFFIMAFFLGRTKWILKHSNRLMKIGGALMVLTGVLLYTDQMTKITIFFIELYGGFTGF
ncbi:MULTISPECIES: cytochrome c biogenesis CcdA family protein [Paenibacillus]|jgi:cytochrome c-type biogenesis protein|uniref:Cytochrome C biogenesis protein CcdA n=1 Tax=Paenibacillus glucanolyticus TaxID=59843 RepID=A0A168ETY9_9BACL|nr:MULTISPECIES: cytochrome c biogenesis protein CcdA [Paenibacillus]MCA4754162.1 sulfite exporter TauE/SafE family protein [Mycolicibacterium fortuitum]ETT40476.1 cytochrome c-type biogenesis protein CcdA [Paenibacillus sp. FSL R5-808]KZS44845.1 cytochrome C biogenesis protein CcdA [Paenibacillus glucanolyticus]MDH6675053.1 cytochrome c-type biogenesis protein [Paenibacillus sp. LBL]MEC0254860.1 cytochrome c biogenesis protein CcdA [Paenibacillus lautus]